MSRIVVIIVIPFARGVWVIKIVDVSGAIETGTSVVSSVISAGWLSQGCVFVAVDVAFFAFAVVFRLSGGFCVLT